MVTCTSPQLTVMHYTCVSVLLRNSFSVALKCKGTRRHCNTSQRTVMYYQKQTCLWASLTITDVALYCWTVWFVMDLHCGTFHCGNLSNMSVYLFTYFGEWVIRGTMYPLLNNVEGKGWNTYFKGSFQILLQIPSATQPDLWESGRCLHQQGDKVLYRYTTSLPSWLVRLPAWISLWCGLWGGTHVIFI